MGAIAIKLHCPKFSHLLEKMQRKITDIDLMGYEKQKSGVIQVLNELGYVLSERARLVVAILQRYIFENPVNKNHIDVFFDKLEMCHTIDFRGRLELDYPTITVSDLFLEKMQIVKINEKDIKDVIVLLREHEVGDKDKEMIDHNYISKLLSKDWGFYYTVTMNMDKVKAFLPRYEVLSSEDKDDVNSKLDMLRDSIEKAEKTSGWKMRAKIGPRKKWYREVEETGI
jgi:hypothetical protein